jgi:hypothetical protein
MAVALAALVIAAGGVAFATITDSSGTFHGCVAKASGNLRVVESADGCRNNERAIAWNQQGPPGGGVVTRMRSGPVSVPQEPFVQEIPLSNSIWEQGADEFQRIEVELSYSQFSCQARLTLRVDDETLVAGDLFQLFGQQKKILFDLPLFETGVARDHELTLLVQSNTNCRTIDSVKIDVLGFR